MAIPHLTSFLDRNNKIASKLFDFIWEDLEQRPELRPNSETLFILVEAEMKRGNFLEAQMIFMNNNLVDIRFADHYEHLWRLLPPLLRLFQSFSFLLMLFLVGLSRNGYPVSIHQALIILSVGSIAIPNETMVQNKEGRTFVTFWIDDRLKIHKVVAFQSLSNNRIVFF